MLGNTWNDDVVLVVPLSVFVVLAVMLIVMVVEVMLAVVAVAVTVAVTVVTVVLLVVLVAVAVVARELVLVSTVAEVMVIDRLSYPSGPFVAHDLPVILR